MFLIFGTIFVVDISCFKSFAMKNLLFIILATLLFSSCSTTYYYSKLSTNNNHISRTSESDFVAENDTLYIIYSFFGENAPINIGVYNKINQPIYVDWSQSALVMGNVAETQVPQNLAKNRFRNSHILYEEDVVIPQNVEVVSPQTQVDYTSYNLEYFPFESISKEHYQKQPFARINKPDLVDVNAAKFNEGESPLRFQSYITVYTFDPDTHKSNRMTFKQSFYLSDLMKTNGSVSPKDVADYQEKKGDFFFVKHQKESTFASVLVGVVLIGGAVALEVVSYSDEYYY